MAALVDGGTSHAVADGRAVRAQGEGRGKSAVVGQGFRLDGWIGFWIADTSTQGGSALPLALVFGHCRFPPRSVKAAWQLVAL